MSNSADQVLDNLSVNNTHNSQEGSVNKSAINNLNGNIKGKVANISNQSIEPINDNSGATNGSRAHLYINRPLGILMLYPSTWTSSMTSLGDPTQLVSFYAPRHNFSDIFPSRLSISVIQFIRNITLADYTTNTLAALNASKQFNILKGGPTTIAGHPAYSIITLSKILPKSHLVLSGMQIWTAVENKIYIVSYSSEQSKFNSDFSNVSKMLRSLRLASIDS